MGNTIHAVWNEELQQRRGSESALVAMSPA